MANKVHILDGNNWFTRHYFTGMDNMTECVGRLTNFCGLHKGRLIFVFDTTKSERRLALYPQYKAGRKSSMTEDEYLRFKALMEQFRLLVKAMGFTVYCGHGYEADDYVSVLSRCLKAYSVYIHSTDKDFLQLVKPNVTVVMSKSDGEHRVTPENFIEEVGVGQEYFIDFKSMIGDKSDNIPGIEGVGEMTAIKYIDQYGSYDQIVEAIKQKQLEKLKKNQPNKTDMNFVDGQESFKLAKELVDLSVNYKDLKLRDLIKAGVKGLKCDLEKCLEILSENNAESSYDLIEALCESRKLK